jgi:hypothetical protein
MRSHYSNFTLELEEANFEPYLNDVNLKPK